MLGHFKKSASILTDQETQMVDNDQWLITICNTDQHAKLCQKPLIYQVLQLKWLPTSIFHLMHAIALGHVFTCVTSFVCKK